MQLSAMTLFNADVEHRGRVLLQSISPAWKICRDLRDQSQQTLSQRMAPTWHLLSTYLAEEILCSALHDAIGEGGGERR